MHHYSIKPILFEYIFSKLYKNISFYVLASQTPKMSGGATIRTNEQTKKSIENGVLNGQVCYR